MTTAAKTATNRMETDVAIVATVTTEASPRTQARVHGSPLGGLGFAPEVLGSAPGVLGSGLGELGFVPEVLGSALGVAGGCQVPQVVDTSQ